MPSLACWVFCLAWISQAVPVAAAQRRKGYKKYCCPLVITLIFIETIVCHNDASQAILIVFGDGLGLRRSRTGATDKE
ncbi:MAG: hypothetical protein OSA93_12850 [Akkermansiaceae bacterium]|nr:hypothetical protein [Akkermansiaceae bacterium]